MRNVYSRVHWYELNEAESWHQDVKQKKGWGGPLRGRQHLTEEPRGHFVILRYRFSPADLKESAASLDADAKLLMQAALLTTSAISKNKYQKKKKKIEKCFCTFFLWISKQALLEKEAVVMTEMLIPPLSFVGNRKKAMQTEVAFWQPGGGEGRELRL